MVEYVGLDVSLKETSVCMLDGSGRVVWRGVCKAIPEAMATTIRKRAPQAERVVLESGTLSTWHWHGLKEHGIPVVCVDARQAKAALSGRPNKSDELDAEGLAQLARTGWYAEVRVKSYDSHRVRSVLVARAKLVGMKRTLSNTIRSLLKTFGQFTQRARGKSFADRVRSLVADEPLLGKGIEGLLASWEAVAQQIRDLDRLLGGLARRDLVCRDIPMTAPVTARPYRLPQQRPNGRTLMAANTWRHRRSIGRPSCSRRVPTAQRTWSPIGHLNRIRQNGGVPGVDTD